MFSAKLAILSADNTPGIIRNCHDAVFKVTMVAVQKIVVSSVSNYKEKQFKELDSPGKGAWQYEDDLQRMKTHPHDTYWEEGEHLYYSGELGDHDET